MEPKSLGAAMIPSKMQLRCIYLRGHYGVITRGDPSKNVFCYVHGVYNDFKIFKIIQKYQKYTKIKIKFSIYKIDHPQSGSLTIADYANDYHIINNVQRQKS